MDDREQLLELAKESVQAALKTLVATRADAVSYEVSDDLPRELKSILDHVLDNEILRRLAPTGLPVLSEESGELAGNQGTDERWVIDPLDGTVNFLRELAPCSVSVGFYHGDTPIFGVIGEYPSLRLAWGGQSMGAYIDNSPLRVSNINKKKKAILCTGFPARFDFGRKSVTRFINLVSGYNKVRMFGSASLSLLRVASGSADAYAEEDIMLWDVAAGLALVEGAGGHICKSPGRHRNSYNVFASNGHLQPD